MARKVAGPSEVYFWIDGVPRATQTGSVRRIARPGKKDRLVVSRRGTEWSAWCQAAAVRAYRPAPPMTGPLSVALTFNLPTPKHGRPVWTSRPDAENLAKGLLDAWNGVLWVDDEQVIRLLIEKQWVIGDRPGVAVTVIPVMA